MISEIDTKDIEFEFFKRYSMVSTVSKLDWYESYMISKIDIKDRIWYPWLTLNIEYDIQGRCKSYEISNVDKKPYSIIWGRYKG